MEEGGMNEFDVMERLEIIGVAKRKAIKCTVITDIICFIVLWLVLIVYGSNQSVTEVIVLIITIIVAIVIMSVFLMVVCQRYFQEEEILKRSNEYVETYLSREEPVEVIPINTEAYREFVFGLHDKGQFYAQIVSEDKVEIYFQYHDETEKRFFEKISKDVFKSYYWVEAEQEEEKQLNEENNN